MTRIQLLIPFMLLISLAGYGQSKVITSPDVDSQIIVHSNYTVSYNRGRLIPNWVSWSIEKDELAKVVSRSGPNFETDPSAGGKTVSTMDYSRSGYDRGHMCPAADNRFSQQAMEESFFLTNVCPQNHTLNERSWADLESACRGWAAHDILYIVCGPYLDGDAHDRIGRAGVTVPDGFWKVILRRFKGRWHAIGFIMPNTDVQDPYRNHAVTVDEVERLTGHDFFSELDDSTEMMVESAYDLSFWK